jgi:hypothetical protein
MITFKIRKRKTFFINPMTLYHWHLSSKISINYTILETHPNVNQKLYVFSRLAWARSQCPIASIFWPGPSLRVRLMFRPARYGIPHPGTAAPSRGASANQLPAPARPHAQPLFQIRCRGNGDANRAYSRSNRPVSGVHPSGRKSFLLRVSYAQILCVSFISPKAADTAS